MGCDGRGDFHGRLDLMLFGSTANIHQRHREERRMGTTQHSLGGRSQQQLAESAEPLGAHHDQVGVLRIDGVQNDFGRISHADVDPGVRRPRGVCRQDSVHEIAQRRSGLRRRQIQAETRLGRLREERIDCGQNSQTAPLPHRQRDGPTKGRLRLVRKINRTDDRVERRQATRLYRNIETSGAG